LQTFLWRELLMKKESDALGKNSSKKVEKSLAMIE
jgi:hypothetical protein